MKNDWKVNQWKESAGMAFEQNEKYIKENNEFYFEVTTEQKDYLEEHMEELDEWCNNTLEMIPHTVEFEPFWNGVEDVYTCDCYF